MLYFYEMQGTSFLNCNTGFQSQLQKEASNQKMLEGSEYNKNCTKGGGVSDLNHYLKQLLDSEKGGG